MILKEIQRYVAAEVNHTRNAKVQKRLDKFVLTFQKCLDTYVTGDSSLLHYVRVTEELSDHEGIAPV